ncbi:dihydrolipoyl dehydrogenase family protein [Aquipuribacter sp. MA13-6]|uniref:dihydrolipoyl dehydrogenase family protein n=1 Tax=unclassified Aquipuribacter TaxID=2635084 RepID=UPI003EEBF14F
MPDPASSSSPAADHPRPDAEEFDLVVLGTGSGGEYVASTAARRGLRVAAVESRLVGGECPFLACVPSKVLLLAATRARRDGTDLTAAWRDAVAGRDEAADHLDDSAKAEDLLEAGVTLVRGRGRVSGPGTVQVDLAGDGSGEGGGARTLRWGTSLVVGTGSAPVVPDLPGLADVPTWTSDEALTSPDLPERLLVLGGGAVGCELSQVYASFGVAVTVVETSPHLLPREDPWVGETLAEHLARAGVDVRAGTSLVRVEQVDGGVRATLRRDGDDDRGDDGGGDGARTEVEEHLVVDRVLVVTGRRPNVAGLGLELLDVSLADGAVAVDDRCRALDADGHPVDGVVAVGDVTALAPYTHTANHHARVVLSQLAGRDVRRRDAGIPRAVYTEPPVFSVGLSEQDARDAGHDVLTAHQDVTETARAFVERVGLAAGSTAAGPAGLRLVADTDGRLLGAAVVGPHADSWGGELALAVTAGLDVSLLAEHVRAFPSWSEAITPAALDLAERVGHPVS